VTAAVIALFGHWLLRTGRLKQDVITYATSSARILTPRNKHRLPTARIKTVWATGGCCAGDEPRRAVDNPSLVAG